MRLHALAMTLALTCLTTGVVSAYDWSAGGWTSFDGHYYRVVVFAGTEERQWLSWYEAAAAARDLHIDGYNTYLATIGSEAEHSFVVSLDAMGGSVEVWLGGFQYPLTTQTPSACWHWIPEAPDGAPTPFGFGDPSAGYYVYPWIYGEPNDCYGPGSEQFLACIGGRWNDYRADDDMHVCRYLVEASPVVPEPAAVGTLLAGASVLCVVSRLRRHGIS